MKRQRSRHTRNLKIQPIFIFRNFSVMNVSRLCPFRSLLMAAGLCLVLTVAPGCDQSPPPRFHANLVQMNNPDNNISPKHQQQIADILLAMYGTPDEPFVLPETGLDIQKLRVAAGPVKGYSQGLFRLHCVHCHGITGDGMGPTALFLKPYPRDYREGWFKFKSTPSKTPPTHDDLVRTLEEGVSGTAMPSFKLLSKSEIDALVEYVEYLSMRGQTELELINQYKLADAFDPDKEDFPTTREFLVDTVLMGANGPVTLWKSRGEPGDRGAEAAGGFSDGSFNRGGPAGVLQQRRLREVPWTHGFGRRAVGVGYVE